MKQLMLTETNAEKESANVYLLSLNGYDGGRSYVLMCTTLLNAASCRWENYLCLSESMYPLYHGWW